MFLRKGRRTKNLFHYDCNLICSNFESYYCILKDVIQAIKETAFVTSEYPVILSFENHCRYRVTFFIYFLVQWMRKMIKLKNATI